MLQLPVTAQANPNIAIIKRTLHNGNHDYSKEKSNNIADVLFREVKFTQVEDEA
jgi:hypothetical protein